MEELVLVQQNLKYETLIKCDKTVKRIEVTFGDKDYRVKSIIVERKEEE